METVRETIVTQKGSSNTSGGWGLDLLWRAVRPRINMPKETRREQCGLRNTRRSWGQILLARVCNTSDNWGQILVKMLTGTRAEPCDDLNTSRGWGRVHQALPVTPPGTEQRGTATRQ